MTARDRAGDGRSPVRTAAGNQGFDFKSSITGPLDGTLAVNGVVVTTANGGQFRLDPRALPGAPGMNGAPGLLLGRSLDSFSICFR